jgi:hypothetical protein
MNSLTTDPVAAVLKRLFQEAESADQPLLEKTIYRSSPPAPMQTKTPSSARRTEGTEKGRT